MEKPLKERSFPSEQRIIFFTALMEKHGKIERPFIHDTAIIDNDRVRVGDDCHIQANTVIGNSGIGAAFDKDNHIIQFKQFGGVEIGDGVYIGTGALIDRATLPRTITKIGDRCIIGPGAHICHNCQISADVMVLGSALLCGGVSIGSGTMVGAGSVIRNKVHIGKGCVVALGSIVTKNMPDNSKWYGRDFHSDQK